MSIIITTESISFDGQLFKKGDVTASKELETKRKSAAGLPMKRVRGFSSASTFIDLEATNVRQGDRIDIKVADTFEALSVSTARTSLGPKESVPLELTGSLNIRPASATSNSNDKHQFHGKYSFTGQHATGGGPLQKDDKKVALEVSGSFEKVSQGGLVVLGDKGSSFTNGNVVIEEGVVSQPGTISQSISIGNLSGTSPSTLGMIGVGNDCHIRIAEGVIVRVNEGSIFKLQCPQPDITVNPIEDIITLSNGGDDETTFTTVQFGTNPQYIPNHLVVPSNQIAIWYGPIYVGRFTLNPFGTEFNADGAGVLNMDLAGQGDNASLRIQNGAQIKVQAF